MALAAYRFGATLELRVLVSARRLGELKAAPEDVEVEVIERVEPATGALQVVNAPVEETGEQQ